MPRIQGFQLRWPIVLLPLLSRTHLMTIRRDTILIVSQQLSQIPHCLLPFWFLPTPQFILRHLVEPMDCHPPEVLPMPRPFVSRAATRSMASPAKLATGEKNTKPKDLRWCLEGYLAQPSKLWGEANVQNDYDRFTYFAYINDDVMYTHSLICSNMIYNIPKLACPRQKTSASQNKKKTVSPLVDGKDQGIVGAAAWLPRPSPFNQDAVMWLFTTRIFSNSTHSPMLSGKDVKLL